MENPTEFKHRAQTCARLALVSPVPAMRRAYAGLAASWFRLASDLESGQRTCRFRRRSDWNFFAAAWFSLCRLEVLGIQQVEGKKGNAHHPMVARDADCRDRPSLPVAHRLAHRAAGSGRVQAFTAEAKAALDEPPPGFPHKGGWLDQPFDTTGRVRPGVERKRKARLFSVPSVWKWAKHKQPKPTPPLNTTRPSAIPRIHGGNHSAVSGGPALLVRFPNRGLGS